MRTCVTLLAICTFAASCTDGNAPDGNAPMDEARRQEIFFAWMSAGLRVEGQTLEQFPTAGEEDTESESAAYAVDLYNRYLGEVAAEFGIPTVEVLAIQVEGMARGWPRPAPDR